MDFLRALAFLTRLPIPFTFVFNEEKMGKTTAFFSLVGVVIGIVIYTVNGFMNPFPDLLKAGLTLLIWVAITGGLHLDGLTDTADGLLSSRSKEKILEIMKDSRTGSMGAMVLSLFLIVKFSAIASIPSCGGRVLIAAPVVGRWIMSGTVCFVPYARLQGGTGKIFSARSGFGEFIISTLIALLVVGLSQSTIGFVVTGCTAVIALVLIGYIKSKLGGMTGDTYGAVCEITETTYLIIYILLKHCFS